MLHIKSKTRSRLGDKLSHDTRVALSQTKPRYDKLVSDKQQQKSH
ncbi:hypothetical protein A3Q56_08350 [Intoshia linei]|uniref:Uncharacterized protein n=1 Tax=Intoshia linei TaxID=1819745 RepID=A0A177AQ78_9BILA|nr:hypothetical protein A3Q56_08350 [Intoshia linei]